MKKISIILFLILSCTNGYGQGYNHQWLLGSYNFFQDPKGRILFDSGSYSLINENRKMVFKGTQANISDAGGNLLMSSNGIWIANATGDTMMNGSGLNPSPFTSNWPNGFPISFGNVALPFPGDTNSLALFHKTLWATLSPTKIGLYYSKIDLSLNAGLGEVIIKNDTILVDTLSFGIGACRHSNGKDWWVITMRDRNPEIYTILLTQNGIDTIFIQPTAFQSNRYGNVSPLVFSPDGKKLICCAPRDQGSGGSVSNGSVLFFDFDRCTGIISNFNSVEVSPISYLWGLAISPSGNYAYACNSNYIFQININNFSVDTVAQYDGFVSPVGSSCCPTSFWSMYLAANGKIYVTSGSGVQHIHEINYPDSAGIACDVQQHAIDLGYAQLRSVPNHPNYYLGCDTTLGCPCLITGIEELGGHEFRFIVAPNPTSGSFKITYLLPQNQPGKLEVFDINGRRIYEMNLPHWSTMQEVSLPKSISSGVYNCVITSGGERGNKKVVVYRE
ncbi:MAG: T9SS type A sorting domain-containing protein [Bacteroidetes bacterium]|nr:T9SS type A sorting domain-containing protein [Bacteroidota bacterium]